MKHCSISSNIYIDFSTISLQPYNIYICMWHDTLDVCMCDVIKTYNDEPFVTSTFLIHAARYSISPGFNAAQFIRPLLNI